MRETLINSGARDSGELRHDQIHREALNARDNNPDFAHMTDLGAVAVRTYTHTEGFWNLNRAFRTGEGLDQQIGYAKTLVSGLNQLPPYVGKTIRFMGEGEGPEVARMLADQFPKDGVYVEPGFMSASKVTDEHQDTLTKKPTVELHIMSRTGRDIEGLSSSPHEREVLSKPRVQLLVTHKELVQLPDTVDENGEVKPGGTKWVIHAEEITPGHPRYLSEEAVDQRIEEQRARTKATNEAQSSYITDRLNPGNKDTDTKAESTHIENPDEHKLYKPAAGWGSINQRSDVLQTPALHHDTVAEDSANGSPARQQRLLDEIAPRMEGVNRKYYDTDPAYQSNGTESLLAYEDRVTHNSQAVADARPVGHPMHDPGVQRDALQARLGGTWTGHNSLADAVNSAGDLPVGSRTALSIDHLDPGPPPTQKHSVLLALSTEHGVALIDPARNRLAQVPADTWTVRSLPYHVEGAPVHSESPAAKADSPPSALSRRLDGPPPAEHDKPQAPPPPKPAAPAISLSDRLDGKQPPVSYAGAAEPGADLSTAKFEAPPPGQHDWSPLARSTNPPSEPAIHAGTANGNQDARYIAERHPELAAVNPHYFDKDAWANGYQTNCGDGVVAYMQRQLGIDATAGPVPPDRLHELGTLDRIQDALGGRFEQHDDYDSVIRAMRDTEPGTHAVIGVQYVDASGETRGHVAIVTNTPHGVAFLDPQTRSLMSLPHPPTRVDLMPVDLNQVAERATADAKTHTASPDAAGQTERPGTAPRHEPATPTSTDRPSPQPVYGSAAEPPSSDPARPGPAQPESGRTDSGRTDSSQPGPAESVDTAREAAALTRTDTGEVNPEAAANLLNSLPTLPDSSEASIREMAGTVFDGDVTLDPVGGRDGRVREERPVYRVLVDGEPVGVVKIVPDGAEFARELSAADRLHNAELTRFGVPDVLAVAAVHGPDGDRRGVLFSSMAPGDSVDALLRRVPLAWDRDRALADLRDAVVGVADGMAELHRDTSDTNSGDTRPASPDYLTPHADAIREHLDRLEARRPVLDRLGIDLDQIRTALDATLDEAMANPGPAGLAHGDAHLGNFLWDANEGTSLIDAPTMHQSMNATGAPIGSPARDFALFDQRIGHFGFEYGLSRDEITQLRTAFAETYTRNGGPPVPPAVKAMFDARAAVHRLTRAVDRFENRPEPRREPDIGAAAAAVQDALGLDNTTATEVANGYAGELPGTPEFRRAWVAADNFRSYMLHTADPATRARFESEYATRIKDLQAEQTAKFKELWGDLFEEKEDEFQLSPEDGVEAERVIRELNEKADTLVNDLAEFAATTGVPDLAEGKVATTIDREGTAAWEASFRETRATIDEVIADYTYRGKPIGYIGSMQSGWRGPHKGKTRFDPYDFDVDLYVVVDQDTFDDIAAEYPELVKSGKIMPDGGEPPDIVDLGEQIGAALKSRFQHVKGIEDSVIAIRVEQPW